MKSEIFSCSPNVYCRLPNIYVQNSFFFFFFLFLFPHLKFPVTLNGKKLENLLFLLSEHEKIKSADSILIVGGGPTGVELAGEIAVDFPDKKVTLVHRGSRLLEFIGERAGKKALDWLISKDVEVILGQSVNLNDASDGIYRTSAGETIKADCHFLCIGKPIASSWLKNTILRENVDVHGKLMVDANLRVKGHKNVFGIGDITDLAVSISISLNKLFLRFLCYSNAVGLSNVISCGYSKERFHSVCNCSFTQQQNHHIPICPCSEQA